RAVRAAEHDRDAHLASRHVVGLCGRVHDVVDRLHREVEGHELDHRAQAAHRGARPDAGKAILGDRGIYYAPRTELLEQPLSDLISALVLGDFLTHYEDAFIKPHFFGHCVAQRLAYGELDHVSAGWNFRVDEIGRAHV